MRAIRRDVLWIGLALAALACADDAAGPGDPGEEPAAAWDLLFYSLAGNGWFAETMVLPPGSGGFPERLFPVGRFAQEAAPSPDGSRIAYVSRDGLGYTHLWVADRDGGNAREIGTGEGGDGWPSWSPDGRRIAFQSDAEGPGDIWVVNADGSGLQRLTHDPLPAVTAEVHPAWSPDGSVIAYAGNEAGNYDIYTVRPDGNDVRRLTRTSDSDLEPGWSPAGDRLVVRRVSLDQAWDLWLLQADGTEIRRIALPGYQRAPAWRADGRVIAFSGRPDNNSPWQVFTLAATDSAPVQQTPDNFTGGHRPMWLKRR